MALVLTAAAFSGSIVLSAQAGDRAGVNRAELSFYGDIGNVVSARNPLLVRPSTLLLTQDGSVALIHLRWVGWDTNVARARGTWSASDCTPSCATGKRTALPARLTLSSPGVVEGHRVYRCFQVFLPSRHATGPRECLQREGTLYLYMPPARRAAQRPSSPLQAPPRTHRSSPRPLPRKTNPSAIGAGMPS